MIHDLLAKLKKLKVNIQHVQGQLEINAAKGVLNNELLEEIRNHKEDLIALLESYKKSKEVHQQIPVVQEQHGYELSSSQQRLWVLSRLGEAAIAYNMPQVYVFEGNLKVASLQYAFNELIKRHESLRTIFKENEQGDVRQFINSPEASVFEIRYKDLRQEEAPDKKVKSLVMEMVAEPFSLASGPLFRSGLYQVGDDRWVFSYVMHHIISDAWSMKILLNELLLYYNAHVRGAAIYLPPLRIQYKDYAAWQQEQVKGEALQLHKAYWLKQFEGGLPVLELLTDSVRPAIKTYNSDQVSRRITAASAGRIKMLMGEQGCTLFMGLLAVVYVLLYKYTRQEDVVIGTTIADREHVDLEQQIGFYVNTLALRTRFKKDDSYKEILEKVKQVCLEGYQHQSYPFDELVNDLGAGRDRSRNPLFDVLVELSGSDKSGQAGSIEPAGFDDLLVKAYEEESKVPGKFDLRFLFTETGEELELLLEYNRDLYDRDTILALGRNLEQLLNAMVAEPDMPVSQLEYVDALERNRLLVLFNDTNVDYITNRSVIELFEEQAEKTPDKMAVSYKAIELTYKELDERSNQLANYLIENHSIQQDDLIGILLERSDWMLIAIIGILKSGGAYVPVDVDLPEVRRRRILEESDVKVLLTEMEFIFSLDYYEGAIVEMSIQQDVTNSSKRSPGIRYQPESLAYVIYTSGSTGMPKGCAVSNGNLSNYIQWANNYYFKEMGGASFGLYTSLSFDLTVTSIFCSLTTGGRLLIYGQNEDPLSILRHSFSSASGINSIKLTPSHIDMLKSLQIKADNILCAIAGGEALTEEQVWVLKEINPLMDVYNEYGPTETTVGCIVKRVEAQTPVLIGKPIANTAVYLLGEGMELCATGVPGELYISGAGVARGYLHQAQLTAEKFLPNPFIKGERMYRTGDWGKWMENGDIQYLGRYDDQIKIRGYRIETGEIEKALLEYPGVQAVVVTVKSFNTGDRELVAYIVNKERIHIPGIKDHLSARLPAYMIPAWYVQVDKIPLTHNGKIDKQGLPDPVNGMLTTGVEYVAPQTDLETELVSIWQDILGKSGIGMNDRFFDLGGHSLKATRLASQLFRKFGVRVELHDLLSDRTLQEQARLIAQAQKNTYNSIPRAKEQAGYVLSSSQRRLLVLSQLDGGSIAYNMPGAYIFEGGLNPAALERSFGALVERHESLRTVFREDEQGNVKQFIVPFEKTGFNIVHQDLRFSARKEEELKSLVQKERSHHFDLRTGPLLRVHLFQVSDDRWVFNYVMHHIISDGWSMGVLIRELLSLYNAEVNAEGEPLPALQLQYKDYASWQQEQIAEGKFQEHSDYWLKQLEGNLPVLQLPGNKARPAVKSYCGGCIHRTLPARLVRDLMTIGQQQDATRYMTLLAAVNALLYRYTGQTDILIGSPVAGRNHWELEGQIGCYINTLVLRTRFGHNDSFERLLVIVKQTALDAYAHQAYPFDELVSKLNIQWDSSRNVLFDVMVVLQDAQQYADREIGEPAGIKVSRYREEEQMFSKLDLSFSFAETGDEIRADIEYNSDIYNREMVERLADHFVQLIEVLVTQPGVSIGKLDFLHSEEMRLLTEVFNRRGWSYPEQTLIQLFEEQVVHTPAAIAVCYEEQKLTYAELNERANRLGAYLRAQYGVGPNVLVGVQLNRSEQLVVALLGVLKAGGAYVPIDPEYPQERTDYMVQDSGCGLVLDEPAWKLFNEHEEKYSGQNLQLLSEPADLAYVIYTSGSTGKPKGVMIEHRNASAFIHWCKQEFETSGFDTVLGVTSICFDLSVFEIFYTLSAGKKLRLLPNALAVMPYLQTEEKLLLNTVPSVVGGLLEEKARLSAVKVLNMAGEPIPVRYLQHLDVEKMEVRNLYGPTEDTTYSTLYRIGKDRQVLIGRPIANTEVYILNEQQGLQPVGITGEIYLAGAGVARGYLNKPELTSERFLPHPWRPAERVYRTGDLARWLADGTIEYLGRKDDQVKIRGYRIELGEIEHALRSYAGVSDAVVLARESESGQKELVAYIEAQTALETAALRAHAGRLLPAYMAPAYYVQLEKLPLTANGKIDKISLANQNANESGKIEYVAPGNEIEARLVEIWQEVLGRDQIGVKDNFFYLGGHSIKALQLITRINKTFSVQINIQTLFKENTIEDLSQQITFILNQDKQRKNKEQLTQIEL